MLQSAMFLALGAAVAGLLALWIAPMIWRRAVRVTERRVEAAIPLSIHEVQADKDQMRADFAVQLRKVEQRSEKLEAKAAQDRVTINEQISRIDALATDRRAKAEIIAQLEDKTKLQQQQLQQSREQATQLRSDLNGRDAKLKERAERIAALQADVRDQENAANAARIEIAALETRGADMVEKLRTASKALSELKTDNADLRKVQRTQQAAIRKLERERAKAEAEINRWRSSAIDLEERLDRGKAELARLKGQPAPALVAGTASRDAKKAAKIAAAVAPEPKVKGQQLAKAVEGDIDSQLADFQAALVKLKGNGPKSDAQRTKLMAQMDNIATRISAANDEALSDNAAKTGVSKGSAKSTKLKGFKKPDPQRAGPAPDEADNDRVASLSDRISALHNLPAAE